MYLIENKENGLARHVALFSAQGVENELESIISSLELLRAGVLLLLLNLEYPMTTTNLGKLTDLRGVKRTDQFVHRKFAEEVEQCLKEYVGRIQYLDEHGIKVKISEDRQREGISESLKNKMTYSHDPSTCPFVVMSHGCLSGSKPAKFNNQTPAEDTSEMNEL
ncbi:hypothetical protein ABFS82_04G006600 [Erythranthe guttata]|uniref:uncharacterized protein LOC105955144 n=1 Tax=Erythranthe guttata TaxID=4155 RepID=UPI00064DDAF8|nr:PREDICTED: uncharacterized protein LOC105955144 [Erythranthe guttata]|eukprot:XP_012834306.1 PREDICTED: uncharacterized protein LOC105955144 [Erythranthe guttata]